MQYKKKHMVHHYNWFYGTINPYTGSPGRHPFDPGNRLQVLFIINCFCDSIGLTPVKVGRKPEESIYNWLPGTMKSELSVFNRLKGIYLYYAY